MWNNPILVCAWQHVGRIVWVYLIVYCLIRSIIMDNSQSKYASPPYYFIAFENLWKYPFILKFQLFMLNCNGACPTKLVYFVMWYSLVYICVTSKYNTNFGIFEKKCIHVFTGSCYTLHVYSIAPPPCCSDTYTCRTIKITVVFVGLPSPIRHFDSPI